MDTASILNAFGLTAEQIAITGAVVLFGIEALKRWLPDVFTGWKTLVASFVIAFGVSAKLLLPDWAGVVSLTILAMVLPAGAKSLVKKVGNGTSG